MIPGAGAEATYPWCNKSQEANGGSMLHGRFQVPVRSEVKIAQKIG